MLRHAIPTLFCCIAIVCIPAALGQTTPPLSYEIVSVRPSDPNSPSVGIDALPNGVGYNAIGVTMYDMLSVMHRIPKRQITGGPDWAHHERFDALVRSDRRYTIDELHAMFQKMLADRFHLKLHIETKTGPVYGLAIAKDGLRMTPVEEGVLRSRPIASDSEDQYTGDHVPMNYLCFWLGMKLENDHRPVIDRTGLSGHYNFKLAFRPQLAPDADATSSLPSIFDAVKGQLGLQLVPQRGPVQTIVIDHIEKPTEN